MENVYADIRRILNALYVIDRGFQTDTERHNFRTALESQNWKLASRILSVEERAATDYGEIAVKRPSPEPTSAGAVSASQDGHTPDVVKAFDSQGVEAMSLLVYLAETIKEAEVTIGRLDTVRRAWPELGACRQDKFRLLTELALKAGRIAAIFDTLEKRGLIEGSYIRAGRVTAIDTIDGIKT